MYHSVGDRYSNGDPAGISHESMMQQVVRLDIQYWFGYIDKSSTDQMIGIFSECLNKLSNQRLIIRQFDAKNPSAIGDAVKRSVYCYNCRPLTIMIITSTLYIIIEVQLRLFCRSITDSVYGSALAAKKA